MNMVVIDSNNLPMHLVAQRGPNLVSPTKLLMTDVFTEVRDERAES